MAAGQIIIPEAMPSRDTNGRAVSSRLYFYNPGTSIQAPVFTAPDLLTQLPQPVVADAGGRWPQIWADKTHAFTVSWTGANGQLIKSYTGIVPADSYVVYDGFALQDLTNVAVPDFRRALTLAGFISQQSQLNVLQAEIAALCRRLCNFSSTSKDGVDLRDYISPSDSLTDAQIAAYPDTGTAGWPDVSGALRLAMMAAWAGNTFVNAEYLSGRYFIDPALPILFPAGFRGPNVRYPTLSYTVGLDGVVRDRIVGGQLIFIVDPKSQYRQVPKIALQANVVVEGLAVVGVGLAADAAAIDVTNYTSGTTPFNRVVGGEEYADDAPVICTDHRHTSDGTSVPVAKVGNVRLECFLVGMLKGVYFGDPLVSEEPWAALTASGNVTGTGNNDIEIKCGPMLRVMGMSRKTSTSMSIKIKSSQPTWSGLTQPNSGGLSGYSWLKLIQQRGRVLDCGHRAVGFDVRIEARGYRYGVFMRAGAGTVPNVGPNGQDTGKYNSATIYVEGERIITAVHVEPDAYMHAVAVELYGHFMDFYNPNGETGPVIEILTDGAVAGAVDKTIGTLIMVNTDYAIGYKGDAGAGNIWVSTAEGVATVLPSQSDPINYNPTTKTFQDPDSSLAWVFRNAGFKPSGLSPFATVSYKGYIRESAGRVFVNTAADGHLEHDMSGLHFSRWSQAKSHHADAAILSASPTTVIVHTNARVVASSNSQTVYDMIDLNKLQIGTNRYLGYSGEGDGAAVIGGTNMPASFFNGKNCVIADFGSAIDDDDDDDGEG
jgi:hypothetical protein